MWNIYLFWVNIPKTKYLLGCQKCDECCLSVPHDVHHKEIQQPSVCRVLQTAVCRYDQTLSHRPPTLGHRGVARQQRSLQCDRLREHNKHKAITTLDEIRLQNTDVTKNRRISRRRIRVQCAVREVCPYLSCFKMSTWHLRLADWQLPGEMFLQWSNWHVSNSALVCLPISRSALTFASHFLVLFQQSFITPLWFPWVFIICIACDLISRFPVWICMDGARQGLSNPSPQRIQHFYVERNVKKSIWEKTCSVVY